MADLRTKPPNMAYIPYLEGIGVLRHPYKLLQFRNKIAHGDNALTVDMAHVVEFSSLIENLMIDIIINVEECNKLETYSNNQNIKNIA